MEHRHEAEDELCLVVKGQHTLKMKEQTLTVRPGELFVVPRGTNHVPPATEGTDVLLIERKTTKHTGKRQTGRTVTTHPRIQSEAKTP